MQSGYHHPIKWALLAFTEEEIGSEVKQLDQGHMAGKEPLKLQFLRPKSILSAVSQLLPLVPL